MRWRYALFLPLSTSLALAAGPFNHRDGARGAEALEPDARGKEAPDRNFDVERLDLSLDLKPAERAVSGLATYTVRRLGPGPLVLDQVQLDIASVEVDGAAASFRTPGDALELEIPGERGQRSKVAIRYSAHPDTGLHFRGQDGDTFPHVFSQGEDDDNRHWLPAWDHPNDRFVYHGEVRAPAGWKAMTNPTDDLVSYLIMVAAGPFEERGSGDNTVWVPPGTAPESVARVLDPIPAMKAHFAERTGVPYPWGSYRQVFVQRFIYLGMENTGATVEDARMLVSNRAAGTGRWIEATVAHELAHQWYGDLLTCRSWRELWLNEGFATFMANDWARHAHGDDVASAAILGFFEASQDGPALAGRFHQGPDAPENGRVYVKGASVLHMLKVMLGEDVFWAGIRRYTTSHQRDLVDSEDLRDAMERESGQELGWFFQQWVELAQVPELTVRSRWQGDQAVITVRQAIGGQKVAYTLPITVELGTPDGPVRRTAWMDDGELEISVPLGAPPGYVAFDPDQGLLAKVDQEQDPAAWAAQLDSPSPVARLVAARALGETDQSEALIKLLEDAKRPLPLRVAAARALGEQRVSAPLLAQLSASEDELREAVAAALGRATGTEVAKALQRRLGAETNPDVRAELLRALGEVDAPLAVLEARRAIRAQGRELEGLRHTAADVLGEHGVSSDLTILLDPKNAFVLRFAPLRPAVVLVERSFEGEEQIRARARIARAAEPLLQNIDLRTRQNALPILAEVGDKHTVALLEAYRRQEAEAELARSALDAIARIQGRVATPPTANEQDVRLEALEKRIEALEKEVEGWRERH